MRRLLPLLLCFLCWTAPAQNTISLYVVGDIMCHKPMINSAFRSGEADFETFFLHLQDRIGQADIAIGNLEFPLAGKPYTGYPAFSGPEEYLRYLEKVGFDVLLTANNHILDKGSGGLRRTLETLEKSNLFYTGISADAQADSLLYPLILRCKGARIALVNFTYGTNLGASTAWPKVNYMKKADILKALERCRTADVVIALPHWGIEYAQHHSEEQEELARWLVSQGVDLIIGTHPHVVQDAQVIDGVPVFYSIGNAISNQKDAPARLEAALTIRLATSPLGPCEILGVETEFLWCTKPGMLEESYSTIPVADYLGRPEAWKQPSDYKLMVKTLEQVQSATGL